MCRVGSMPSSPAGMCISGELSRGPASIRQTLRAGSALSRLASTQPAEPAPTMTVSNCTRDTLPRAAPNATPRPNFSQCGRLWVEPSRVAVDDFAFSRAQAASHEFLRRNPALWRRGSSHRRACRAGESAYRIEGATGRLRLPLPVSARRTDGLWQHTCFEAFLKADASDSYYEFNFAPSGEWAAYRFGGRRIDPTSPDMPAPAIELPALRGVAAS